MKRNQTNQKIKQGIAFISLFVFSASNSFAQFKANESGEVVESITEIGKIVYLIIYAIAAVVGLAGALHVAWAYWSDKQNPGELVKKWIIGFAIIALAGVVVHMFTGIKLGD